MVRLEICNYKQKFILLHYIKGCVLNREGVMGLHGAVNEQNTTNNK